MVAISPMRMMFTIVLVITLVLGVISMILSLAQAKWQSPSEDAYISFNIIGVVSMAVSSLLMFLLLFACGNRYKPMMLSIIICTAIGMVCYSISVGVVSSLISLDAESWMLSTLWVSVVAFIMALIFLFSDPESI